MRLPSSNAAAVASSRIRSSGRAGLVDWDGFRVAVALADVDELLAGIADALYSVRVRSGQPGEVVVLLVRASTWVASAARVDGRVDHDDLVRAAALLEVVLLVDRVAAGKRPPAIRDWTRGARNLIVSVDAAIHAAGPHPPSTAFAHPTTGSGASRTDPRSGRWTCRERQRRNKRPVKWWK